MQMLKDKGLTFDYAFTSALSRAIKTLFYIQDAMDLHWVPVTRDWRLNERHYGSLQGLNKAETAAKHGEEQVKVRNVRWPPPAACEGFPRHNINIPDCTRRLRGSVASVQMERNQEMGGKERREEKEAGGKKRGSKNGRGNGEQGGGDGKEDVRERW